MTLILEIGGKMRNRVVLHSGIKEEHKKLVRKASTDLGLDTILKNGTYDLLKKQGSYDIYVLKEGKVQIVGGDIHVALFISNFKGEWFRSSPIKSCERNGITITITTMNSTYYLKGN